MMISVKYFAAACGATAPARRNIDMRLAAAYLAVAGTLLVLDIGWVGFVAHDFYAPHVNSLLDNHGTLLAAAAYVVAVTVAVVLLAVRPALDRRSSAWAMLVGAVLGLVVFVSFDLSGLALAEDLAPRAMIADMLWHVTLMAIAARAGYAAVA